MMKNVRVMGMMGGFVASACDFRFFFSKSLSIDLGIGLEKHGKI